MEASTAKRGMYPLAFFMTLILLNARCYGAAVLVESNSTFRCDGRLDDCLIEDDLELEILFNPYVSRILQGNSHPTSGTSNSGRPACDSASNHGYSCGGPPAPSPNGRSSPYDRTNQNKKP